MTVRDACQWAANELSSLESARLEAEILLCHLMKRKRYSLYLHYSDELDPSILENYRKMVCRRKNHEPIQHITGITEFLGKAFIVGPGALVPRPETEILIELFIKKLTIAPGLLLDIGTGSGILAVSLAIEYPSAMVIGSDISREALRIAAANKTCHKTENLLLIQSNLFSALKGEAVLFDGVIANLPYIPSFEIDTLEPEVSIWDPRIALEGGNDGLGLVRILLVEVPPLLRKGGVLALELASDQVPVVVKLLENDQRWSRVEFENDLAGRMRVVLAIRS